MFILFAGYVKSSPAAQLSAQSLDLKVRVPYSQTQLPNEVTLKYVNITETA